jgi:hypothetical protein
MTDRIHQRIEELEQELRLLRLQLLNTNSPQTGRPTGNSNRHWTANASATAANWRTNESPDREKRAHNGNEIPPLKRAPRHELYRLIVNTYHRGNGGTEGDAYFRFVGSTGFENATGWLYCDNPHSSYHQPSDVEVYYFYNPDMGREVKFELALEANRSPAEDGWRWEAWLLRLDHQQWTDVLHIPERDSPAANDLGCDTFRITGAAHLDGRTKQWTTWKAAGIDFPEVPDFTPTLGQRLKVMGS